MTEIIRSLRQAIDAIGELRAEIQQRDERIDLLEARLISIEADWTPIDKRVPIKAPPFPVEILAEIGIRPPWDRRKGDHAWKGRGRDSRL